MVEETPFREVINFLGKIGVYDVILPFLLVFTIVFAILEKTKILGVEKIDNKEVTKKNINAMVALAVAFLVVASTKLVAVINDVLANIVLLLVLAICFLLLVGVFMGDKEFTMKDYPKWVKFFMFFMFIGIVLIFLNALQWLDFLLDIVREWPAQWATTAAFLIVILIFLYYITAEPGKPAEAKKDK